MFVALCALGTWQVQRLHWKNDVLARIEASERSPPTPLGASAEPYAKVVAAGRFDHEREALLGVEVRGTTLGAHLLTPLLRAGHAPVLVDRGWIPLERNRPVDRPEGEISVTGFVRDADRRDWLSPEDDAPGRRFYVFDPEAIGSALGLPEAPAPFGLVALAPRTAAPAGAGPSPLPEPARGLPRPNNPHLGYAITWYGLAASLVAVLVAFARRRDDAATTTGDHSA
ncbi:SURF1 family protein [Craurococcus roseus]|uniref:SURF1-like protein n=1 Tax=Craurococcus roseus TaxID=77585 RepID=A0ABP3PLK3_9PROT